MNHISRWWHGETKSFNDASLFGVYTERHWTSTWAHAFVDFYLRNWKWLWGSAIAIAGILVAAFGE